MKWLPYNKTLVSATGTFHAYRKVDWMRLIVLGKIEGAEKDDEKKNWHGHVSVSGSWLIYRRLRWRRTREGRDSRGI